MNIAFFDTKPYDYIWFEPLSKEYGYEIRYCDYRLGADTAVLAKGYDVACAAPDTTMWMWPLPQRRSFQWSECPAILRRL